MDLLDFSFLSPLVNLIEFQKTIPSKQTIGKIGKTKADKAWEANPR
jgi:hypothetical protein